MNTQNLNITSATLCPHHSEKIIQLDAEPNIELGKRALCVECEGKKPMSLKKSFEKLSLYNEMQQKRNQELASIMIKSLEDLRKGLIQEINQVITKIIIQLNSIVAPTPEAIENMNLSELQEFGEKISKFLISGEQSTSFYQYIFELKPRIYKVLDNFIFLTNKRAQEELIKNGKTQQVQVQEENDNQCNFQYIKRNELRYETCCKAIVFNNNGNIMISSSNSDIIVWEFQAGMLKEQKILRDHYSDVTSLCYSKKQNLFFSGDVDGQIVVWYLHKMASKFNDHKGQINQMILLNNENIMISSSNDSTIRIWNYIRSEWKSGQILRYHKGPVYQIDLNDHQNLMVSIGQDNQIIIWEVKENQQWYQKGSLQLNSQFLRASFLTNQKFIIGSSASNLISIYEFNVSQKQCQKIVDSKIDEEVQDREYFPFIYNSAKNILINKYLNKIQIISKPISQMNIIQTLIFDKDITAAQLTQDGNYFIVFDNSQQKFVIYQFQV